MHCLSTSKLFLLLTSFILTEFTVPPIITSSSQLPLPRPDSLLPPLGVFGLESDRVMLADLDHLDLYLFLITWLFLAVINHLT